MSGEIWKEVQGEVWGCEGRCGEVWEEVKGDVGEVWKCWGV